MLSKYIELLKEIQQEKDSVDSVNINSRIMLIDGTNFYLRCFMANPSLNENGEHLGGSLGFLRSLGSYIKTFKPTRVIITFDGKGGSQKRRDIFSDYKGNRLNTFEEGLNDLIKWKKNPTADNWIKIFGYKSASGQSRTSEFSKNLMNYLK